MQMECTVGVLLAAGAGSRFDPINPGRKLDVLVDGTPVAEHAFNAVAKAVDAVVVAARSRDGLLARLAADRGARVVTPPDAAMGMGHSLAAAVTAAREAFPGMRLIVVALADMPWVRTQTVARLIDVAKAADRIVQPRCGGQRGHPVVFPARYLDALARCRGDIGARGVLRDNADDVMFIDVDDRGVLRDVDTPGDVSA